MRTRLSLPLTTSLAALLIAPASVICAQQPAQTQTTQPAQTQTTTRAGTQTSSGNSAPADGSSKTNSAGNAQGSADSKTQTAQTNSKAKPAAKKDAKKQAAQAPIPAVGQDLDTHIRKGSEEDVNAVGERKIGARGMGNWYSTSWEVSVGKQYSMEIDKTAHLITDPVVTEYVNRIGQNLVKNSDAKVPFTIKVLDTDEINAMALPGGFFYVNSGLILACDSEDELAGVMAHEIAHVAAHHAAREMTRMNYMEIASIPVMIVAEGSYTGYGIYEASQLAIPLTFLQFSRQFEAEADFLGVQYMYKAGYDPQGMVSIFEKLDALEKHKPGAISRAFSDHPATPDRIAAIENEIATLLPPRPEYLVTTSEFDRVKARLARIQNKRGINDKKNAGKPTLRRVGGSNNPDNPNSSGNNQPVLEQRN